MIGPVQLLIIGFQTSERFHGDVARELLDLRGRGLIRVLDARLFLRADDGRLIEIDLGQQLADRPEQRGNPVAHLLGVNGAGANGGNGGTLGPDALAGTAGFALEDLQRLTDEIGPGEHAAVVLVEHLWATHLREAMLEAGGRLVGQGFLTPDLLMVVGSELQAHADAQAALELADAARGAALLDALTVLGPAQQGTAEDRARAAADVVRLLVDEGFVHTADASSAIDALATAGLIESATFAAAAAEAEDLLSRKPE